MKHSLYIIQLSLLSIAANYVFANSIEVDSTHKTTGTMSLRTAIATAISGDTIKFVSSIDGDSIKLTTELILNKNVVIIGNGTSKTIIDGMGVCRLFYIPVNVTAYISGMTMQNGNGVGASSANGGAIFNEGGVLNLTSVIISENSSPVGGGVLNQGTLTFTNSTISRNSAFIQGGGINNANSGTLTFNKSIISGNSAGSSGGGVLNVDGNANFTNSIISGNFAQNGGGISVFNSGTLTFTSSTITGNASRNSGGGVLNGGVSTISITNCIVAKNTSPFGADIAITGSGSIITYGHNFVKDSTGGHGITDGNGIEPLFVADTPAAPSVEGDQRLQCDSPAIDAGNNANNMSTEDILGNPRISGDIDLGPYEREIDVGIKTIFETANDGPGSLRFVASSACSGDTIIFSSEINGDTIKLTTELVIDTNLFIIGNDTTKTIIDGQMTSRIFYFPLGDTVYIEGIKMQNGNGAGTIHPGRGGAILNQGTVNFLNCAILGNKYTNLGSDCAVGGGGVYNSGTTSNANFINSSISGNNAGDGSGGGVYNTLGTVNFTNSIISGNSASRSGGITNSSGTVNLINSIVTNNSASHSGGGITSSGTNSKTYILNSILSKNTSTYRGGGLSVNSCTADIINSSITGNSAGDGGGIYNSSSSINVNNTILSNNNSQRGGGIYNSGNTMASFSNSTISGNNSNDGGGVYSFGSSIIVNLTNSIISGNNASNGEGGGLHNTYGTATLINSTVSGNSAASGGGVYSFAGVASFTNSIVAQNIDNGQGKDVFRSFGTVIDNGNNIIGNNKSVESSFPTGNPNIARSFVGRTDSEMIPLFNIIVPGAPSEGGDLRVQCGSPAIDMGKLDTTELNLGYSDLAGISRVIAGRIDIGAYEHQAECHEIQVVYKNTAIINDGDLTPSTEDGTYNICGDKVDSFYIQNAGQQQLIIDTILMEKAISSGYEYNEGDFVFPDTLYVGDSVLLEIRFDPINSDLDSAIIVIVNNDADEYNYEFKVKAVLDTLKPKAICQDLNVFLNANGDVTISDNNINNGSSDICGIKSTVIDVNSFNCDDIGANIVTLAVTDNNDNVATCMSTVTVNDTIKPILSCIELITLQLDETGTANLTISDVLNSASDNCGSSTLRLSQTTFDCDDVGVVMDTLIASDLSGNFSYCIVTITVVAANICSLDLCFDDVLLVDATLLSTQNPPDILRVSNTLSSNAIIDRNLQFKAGIGIELLPGFEVHYNTSVLMQIEDCRE